MATAGFIITRPDGKMLFQLRDTTPGISDPGCWGLFGGHLEEGESVEDAAVRELKEELGVTLTKEQLGKAVKVGSSEKHGDNFVFYLHVDWKKEDLILGEGQAMEYFSLEEILAKENLSPDLREKKHMALDPNL